MCDEVMSFSSVKGSKNIQNTKCTIGNLMYHILSYGIHDVSRVLFFHFAPDDHLRLRNGEKRVIHELNIENFCFMLQLQGK